MLFKPYHLPQIRSESKTVTRREWSDNYNAPNPGTVLAAKTELFTSDDDADCFIRILDVYEQPLGEMTDEDARAEGDYDTLAEFREGYEQVYGEGAWDDDKVVTVVEFEYVGRDRPADQQLVTDGGELAEGADRDCPNCGEEGELLAGELLACRSNVPKCRVLHFYEGYGTEVGQ